MESWNQRYIPKPANYTKVYNRDELESVDSETNKCEGVENSENINPEKWLRSLISILKAFNSHIATTGKHMSYESKYLYAYIYQNGCLKKEKFMQAIKKVGKCLKRWNEVDLKYLLSDVLEIMPTDFFFIKSIRLPSTHYMYYLLQRLVATFYLLLKCVSYCMEAAVYFRSKIILGHFIGVATLGYGIVGRIRALSLDLADSIAKASDELHPYVMALVRVFPHDKTETLPRNLKEELAQFRKREERVKKPVDQKKGLRNLKTQDENYLVNEDDEVEEDPNREENVEINDNIDETSILDLENDDFKFNVSLHIEDDDVGEQFSQERFEALKKLSHNVIESSSGAKGSELRKEEGMHEVVGDGKKKKVAKRKRTALGVNGDISGKRLKNAKFKNEHTPKSDGKLLKKNKKAKFKRKLTSSNESDDDSLIKIKKAKFKRKRPPLNEGDDDSIKKTKFKRKLAPLNESNDESLIKTKKSKFRSKQTPLNEGDDDSIKKTKKAKFRRKQTHRNEGDDVYTRISVKDSSNEQDSVISENMPSFTNSQGITKVTKKKKLKVKNGFRSSHKRQKHRYFVLDNADNEAPLSKGKAESNK